MGFQLGNLYVEKGQKTCGFLKLPFTEDELPVTLIYGREEVTDRLSRWRYP